MSESSIIIDIHEPYHLVEKIKELGVPIVQEALDVGDYIVGDILIERKTYPDLMNSVRSGRIWDQLFNLSQTNKKCYLTIIGEIPTYNWKLNRPFTKEEYLHYLRVSLAVEVRAFLSFGVAVRYFKSESEFVNFIEYLWKYSGRKPSGPVILKKAETVSEVKRDMLSRIPGLGNKAVEEICKLKLSIKDLCDMTIDQIASIKIGDKRLGEKRASKIKEVLEFKE